MGGHAAACGQDAGGVEHALQVFGRSFDADQNRTLVFLLEHFFGIFGEEYHRTGRCARRCGQSLHDDFGVFHRRLVENGVEQLVEFGRLAAQYGGLFVDQAFAQHVHGDLHHRGARTLAVATLEHPEFAVLDREFDVLHILEILLQVVLYLVEFFIYGRHHLFERGVFAATLGFRYVLCLRPAARTLDGDLLGSADARYHVFALCVDQVFAVEEVFTRCCVAREGYAGRRVVAHVAEYHRLYRYGRAPFRRNVVELAVKDGTLVHPRTEYGTDSAPELIPGICREILAGLFLYGCLEVVHQLLQVVGRQVGVVFHAALLFLRIDQLLERIVLLFRSGLHAQHHVAVHLYETAVRVPCETGIARALGYGFHGLVVHTQVEDGVHHARHRSACTRTDRYQQRHLFVAELHAGQFFDVLHRLLHFGAKQPHDFLASLCVVFAAYFGGDGESRGNRNTDQVHFGQVRTLTAEQFPHFAVTFRFLVAEGIDSFNVCHNLSLLIIIVFFPINVLFQSCFRRAAGEAFHWEGNGEKTVFSGGAKIR